MDPWANGWADDNDTAADKPAPFASSSSPPLRPLSSLGGIGASSSSAWDIGAPTASTSTAGTGTSQWSPKFSTTEDTPWASEIDPVALPLPSIARLNLHDEDEEEAEARETDKREELEPGSKAYALSSGSLEMNASSRRSEPAEGSSKDLEEEQDEDVGWGKMDLPPLSSPSRAASPAGDDQGQVKGLGLDDEAWGAMDLPPLRTAEDALPTWDNSTEDRRREESQGDGLDPWKPPDAEHHEEEPSQHEPTPEEVEAILDKMRQASAEPTNIPSAAFSPTLGANSSKTSTARNSQDAPKPEQLPQSTEQPQHRPTASTSAASSFLGSVFRRKAAAPTPPPPASDPPQTSTSPAPAVTEPSAVTSPTTASTGISSFFSKARASTSTPDQSPKPSLDTARPTIEVPSSSPEPTLSGPQPEQQTGGVRRFFSRFSKQAAANPEDEHQHVTPNHKASNGVKEEAEEADDGWLGRQEIDVLNMAGVSTLSAATAGNARSSSAPTVKTNRNLLDASPVVSQQQDSASMNAFFDAFEKQPARPTSSVSSGKRADELDPFAALIAPPQPKQPQGIPVRLHQPKPSRPVSVPALPPPPSISRPSSVQSNTHRPSPLLHQPPSRPSSSSIPALPPPPRSGAPSSLGSTQTKNTSIDDFGEFTSSPVLPSFQQPLAPVKKPQQQPTGQQGSLSKADFDFFEGL